MKMTKSSHPGEDHSQGKLPTKKKLCWSLTNPQGPLFSGKDLLYNEADFERCFQMKCTIFNKLFQGLQGCDPFVQKRDCTGKDGIHPLCRFVACLHHFAYGDGCDLKDEYLQLSESTLSLSVKAFAKLVVEKFGKQYLNRSPNCNEVKYLF